VLAIAPMGAFNVHGALLPAYRGANPTQWALLNDERETGVTIHCMTGEFDAGDIVGERRVPIHFTDTWLDIHSRIRQATEDLLAEQLPRILDGSYDRRAQDPDAARHFRRRRPEDGRIDWAAGVLAIYNLIRALVAPNPGASYVEHGETVVIDRYLTISEVAALKHARPEVREPTATTLMLTARPQGGNEAVLLAAQRIEDGSEVGKATVGDIDWDQRSARLTVEAGADAAQEIRILAHEFATIELGLTEVADAAR
jgi:methionyl-tRNA formyltransferase